jgi:hypothetical protein
MTYVEGYAISDRGSGHLHAWCVDGAGNVLDRTWVGGQAYFGIRFQTSFLKKTISARRRAGYLYYGLLDDWMAKFPLMNALARCPELWLANV